MKGYSQQKLYRNNQKKWKCRIRNTKKDKKKRRQKESKNNKRVCIFWWHHNKTSETLGIFKKVIYDYKVYIRHFSGATIDCRKDYVKPYLKNSPDHFILHLGTNDLIPNQTSEQTATSIINLSPWMKEESCDVSISSIILRTDDKRLYEKMVTKGKSTNWTWTIMVPGC